MADGNDRNALLHDIEDIPAQIRRAAEATRARPAPGGQWSANAILGHMLWTETDIWQYRFRRVAVEDNPRWEWRDQAGVDLEAQFGPQPLEGLLGRFEALRGETVAHLRGLSDAGWARRGTHAVFGEIDVAGLCREMLKHDREHLEELRSRA